MEEPTDPRLARLRQLVEAMVASLATLLARYRETGTALAKNESALRAAQEEMNTNANARTELEGLSAVGLNRRGISAEEATSQADDLRGREDAAQQRVDTLSEERARLSQQRSADYREIATLLPNLAENSSLLGEAEFVAEIGSMINYVEEEVPSLTQGTSDRLFAKTKAHAVYTDRKLRIRRANGESDLIAIAQEVARQPLIPTRQHAPHLPHPNNCVLTRSIDQIVSASR